ncbi:hypothetical protein OIU79_001632 [Salix purpurea]|uniref:Uncharacterized protein n=1 Tax=Salix purpurea TaxID=77065 RepID=A0A9Q0UR71_SALPP|nr:hypothetical protein OIU79_001632 [Salix purpurea]
MEHSEETQGLVVAGGGERNGMEGSVVGIGIVGIEGMLESGGKVTFGTVGRVGMLGSGGKVSFGTAGIVGIVGRLGSGGKVRDGRQIWQLQKITSCFATKKRQSNEESQENTLESCHAGNVPRPDHKTMRQDTNNNNKMIAGNSE